MARRVLEIHKAEPYMQREAPDAEVRIFKETPRNGAELTQALHADAVAIEQVLFHSLPGITFSYLLILMLERRALTLRVALSYGEE